VTASISRITLKNIFVSICCRKKVVIHVPTSVKHIHHHHTSKVIVSPKHHHGYGLGGDSSPKSKGLNNMNGWSEEHVVGLDFGTSDHEVQYRSKGQEERGHSQWHGGKSSRSVESGMKYGASRVGSTGGWKVQGDSSFDDKRYGGWHVVKDHDGDLEGLVHGKFHSHGLGSEGRIQEMWRKFSGLEGGIITGTTGSEGRYEVKEHLDEGEGHDARIVRQGESDGGLTTGNWNGMESRRGYSGEPFEGNSYSSFVIHNPKSRSHST
jgi:hypothetical protein